MIFCVVLCLGMRTLVIVFEVRYYFFEVIFAEGGEDFFLVLFANNYMAVCRCVYLISFSMEFMSNSFSYIFELL